MKTTKTMSRANGRELDKQAKTAKQMAKDTAANLAAYGVESLYFREVLIGHLADKQAKTEKKQQGETAADYSRRLLAAAKAEAAAMSEADKKETYIYKQMATTDNMFSLLRAALPVIVTDGGQMFGRERVIGYAADTLTAAELADMTEDKENGARFVSVDIVQAQAEAAELSRTYIVRAEYSDKVCEMLATAAKYRRKLFGEITDTTAAYYRKGRDIICTMTKQDATKWMEICPILSDAAQVENAARIERNKQAEAAAKAERAAAAELAAFIDTKAGELAAACDDIKAKAEAAADGISKAAADKQRKATGAKMAQAEATEAKAAQAEAAAKAEATEAAEMAAEFVAEVERITNAANDGNQTAAAAPDDMTIKATEAQTEAAAKMAKAEAAEATAAKVREAAAKVREAATAAEAAIEAATERAAAAKAAKAKAKATEAAAA